MKKIMFGIFTAAFAMVFSVTAALTPIDLRCDYAVNPLGVDSQNPRLFWKLSGRERGEKQIAYQVLVASAEKNLARDNGDLWNSGKVESDDSIQIAYAGAVLNSSQQIHGAKEVMAGWCLTCRSISPASPQD